MRVKVLLLAAVFAGGLFEAAAYAATPDWFLIDENPESKFFYDRNGITQVREGVIRVRARVVYSEAGRKKALEVLKELPPSAPLYESLYSYEINCPEQEGHLLAAGHYDDKGSLLRSSDLSAGTRWEYLEPGARLAVVAGEACRR